MIPCSFTGVGSLPFRSKEKALSHVFSRYPIPFLPQLPKVSPKEGLVFQGYVNSILTASIMICAVIIILDSFRIWYKSVFVEKKEILVKEAVPD